MKRVRRLHWILLAGMLPWLRGGAQPPAEELSSSAAPLRLKFNNAPIEMLLDAYSEQTGRTLLIAPTVPKANVTLRSQTDLTLPEYLDAIEAVLGMNGIALIKEGDKFLRVVPNTAARTEPLGIRDYTETTPLKDSAEIISQMIPLRHIEPADAQKAIEPLKHPYGQIHVFERINSILVTDTAANVNRMLQVLAYIDQPVEAREETFVFTIRYAKAADIKKKIEEIIAEAQKDQQKSTIPQPRLSGPPGVVSTPTTQPLIPGLIRAARPATPAETTPAQVAAAQTASLAERGIITGTVKMVADDRTNILIIITRPENLKFFRYIIDTLDRETAPDVIVRIFRLEFAEAKTVAGMLNELIGATTAKEEPKTAPPAKEGAAESGEAKALREYVERLTTPAAAPAAEAKTKVGQLSKENIKIMSDERTNSLIIMASKSDLATLADIIKDMDMMLSQVLIEAVLMEIKLTGEVRSGVGWLQKSMMAYNKKADGRRTAAFAFGGGGGGKDLLPIDATGNITYPSMGGLSYYLTLFGVDLDVIIAMASSDSRTRVISTPAILTTDNKEAKIKSTESIYVYKGTTYQGTYGTTVENFDTQEVGLVLTVKPHINTNKVVMMEITQVISEPGDVGRQVAGGRISSQREITASIAVHNRQTIMLGGLVRDDSSASRTKIPILGDIPIVGRLFNSSLDNKGRLETVVFITPYVLDTAEEIRAETQKRRASLNIEDRHGTPAFSEQGEIQTWHSGSRAVDKADTRR